MTDETAGAAGFEAFVIEAEPRLRRALVSAYGAESGREATAEALAWGWEHWDRLRAMENPVGYLFRVGQSRRPRRRRPPVVFPPVDSADEPWFEPGLPRALASLTEHQRVVTVLVHGFGWTLREVGDLLGIKVTSAQNHLERGLAKLRAHLEVQPDA
jgi:RNA polymerase sigma factor (sigma-70 family)